MQCSIPQTSQLTGLRALLAFALPDPWPLVLEGLLLALLLVLQLLWVVLSAEGTAPCALLPLPGVAAHAPCASAPGSSAAPAPAAASCTCAVIRPPAAPGPPILACSSTRIVIIKAPSI